MADPPRFSDTGDDTGERSDRESSTSTPRWVKVFGIIAIVVVLLFVIMLVAGGGRHGPGRHRLSEGAPHGRTPPAVTEGGRTPPESGH